MVRMFVIFLLLTNTTLAQVNLSQGLIAYYPFNGNANDASGNSINGSVTNATLTADRFGISNAAYYFNASNSFIELPYSNLYNFAPQDSFSISLWVLPDQGYSWPAQAVVVKAPFHTDYTLSQWNYGSYILNYKAMSGYAYNHVLNGTTTFSSTQCWYNIITTYKNGVWKLYINGVLEASDLTQTKFILQDGFSKIVFGKKGESFGDWYKGKLDEVRLYNRVLNQSEATALACTPCMPLNPIGNIINNYTPILAFNPCDNKITVEDASAFNTGDTVMMIQMKGAVIDSSNTANFGTITNYGNAGNYEFNFVKSKSGNIIELKNAILRQYDIPLGKVQLIRVPFYPNATVVTTLTCLPWDGNKGGVLVLNAQDTITLNADIDVSGTGFNGGIDPYSNPAGYNCYENNFYYPPNPDLASGKGESIGLISSSKSFGKGALANGGGGGNSHNSGGGGGSNGTTGGFGGYNFEGAPCTNTPFDNRGIGGRALTYSNSVNKIFCGGGGGAGHTNNPQAFQAKGGNGGGIAIIIGNNLKTNSFKIKNNGIEGLECGTSSSACHEGMGGGGAGGTTLLSVNSSIDIASLETKGGKGGDMTAMGFLKVGPGGGGSGGVLWIPQPTLPANINHLTTGGLNGVTTAYGNDSFGATPGNTGINLFGLQIPVGTAPFKPNIDSVRVKDSLITCSHFDLKGLGFTNNNPIISWEWFFGDGGTAATQNTNHNYLTPGNYTIKLVVTDINGCKDSITKDVMVSVMTMDAGPDDTICITSSTTLQSSASGASQYVWTPAAFLSNPTILNPVASPRLSTTFYLTATNTAGCSLTDSVRIEVRSASVFAINAPNSICPGGSFQLTASGGDLYTWSPANSLNNSGIPNPIATPAITTPYTVNIMDTLCGFSTTLSTSVAVRPLPFVKAGKSNDIDCSLPQSQLIATGALIYNWSPAGTLSNSSIANPVATPTVSTEYSVTGTDSFGCVNKDSIIVKVSADNKSQYLMPSAFTPNNDGLNDCYGVKYWGQILELEFSIYNRWGERIFFSRAPNTCWDGTIRGVQQNPGVFVYVIKAKTSCQDNIFRKGTFALIR